MCKAFDDLIRKVKKEAWERGMKRGEATKEREVVANAMEKNLPLELVADLLKIPVCTVKQIADQLKAKAKACL